MEMVGKILEGFAALIGLDWADKKHDVCLWDPGTDRIERKVVEQTPEALDNWASELRKRFPGKKVAIALDQSKGPLVFALMKYEHITLFPINPKMAKKFRDALFPSGAKNDEGDAWLHLEILRKHPNNLKACKPDTEQTRYLAQLTQDRRNAVDERTRYTNRLREVLKRYFPQALHWSSSDLGNPMSCRFLLKWPTLEQVKRARPGTLRNFYKANGCRRGDVIDRRIEEIKTATPLVTDQAIIKASVMQVRMLANLLLQLDVAIGQYDAEIAKVYGDHPEAPLYDALPASGTQLAPRLLGAFGTDRDRFDSPDELACLLGIAPITVQSGKSRVVQWRRGCPKFQRQSIHEWANCSRRKSLWASAYYDQQRERGLGHHAAVRALAFKWIRIIFACWKSRTPYDEKRYLAALERSGSPLVARIAELA